MVRLGFSSQGAGTPASTARRATAWKTRRRERREVAESSSSAIAAAGAGSHSTLSLSLFFCFSLLKKKRRPPRRRAAAASALDSLPLRSRRENSDPAARRGRGATQQEEPRAGRRPGRWSRLQGQKAISMPPPLFACWSSFFLSLLCSIQQREERSSRALSSSRPPQALEMAAARLLSRAGGWSAFARYHTYHEKHEQRRTWLRSGARKNG